MKKYKDFINENESNVEKEISKYYYSLDFFKRFLIDDLSGLGYNINLNIDSFGYGSKMVNGVLHFPFSIELKTQFLESIDIDIPDFFILLRDFFKPYFYIKMKKADSTVNYNIYINFNKLINSEIFWDKIFIIIDKFYSKLTNKKHFVENIKLMKEETPKWAQEKYSNTFKSILAIDKFNL